MHVATWIFFRRFATPLDLGSQKEKAKNFLTAFVRINILDVEKNYAHNFVSLVIISIHV